MNKKDKEEAKVVKKLIKSLKKGFGANCPELNIECASCKAQVMISYLEWYLDHLEWDIKNGKIAKKIEENINKVRELIKTPLNGKVKKSKTVGKF